MPWPGWIRLKWVWLELYFRGLARPGLATSSQTGDSLARLGGAGRVRQDPTKLRWAWYARAARFWIALASFASTEEGLQASWNALGFDSGWHWHSSCGNGWNILRSLGRAPWRWLSQEIFPCWTLPLAPRWWFIWQRVVSGLALPCVGLSWFGPGYALRHSAAVQKRLGTDAQGTLAIDLCLKFLMELFSPHEVGRRQDAGLVWLDPSWLGLESTSGLTVLARAGVIRSCTGN